MHLSTFWTLLALHGLVTWRLTFRKIELVLDGNLGTFSCWEIRSARAIVRAFTEYKKLFFASGFRYGHVQLYFATNEC